MTVQTANKFTFTPTHESAPFAQKYRTWLFLHVGAWLGGGADLHQRKSQKIETTPQIRIVRPVIVLGEADSPDPVDRTRLDENA